MSDVERRPYVERSGGRVMVKQAEAGEADINKIVQRHINTGVMPVNTGEPLYGDFSDALDYHGMCERINRAEDDFSSLPALVRDLCANDLGNLISMLQDPDQVEALREAGLTEAHEPAFTVEPNETPQPTSDTPPQEPDQKGSKPKPA